MTNGILFDDAAAERMRKAGCSFVALHIQEGQIRPDSDDTGINGLRHVKGLIARAHGLFPALVVTLEATNGHAFEDLTSFFRSASEYEYVLITLARDFSQIDPRVAQRDVEISPMLAHLAAAGFSPAAFVGGRHHRDVPRWYVFQCYQEAGRIVPGLESVDREEVVRELVASGVVEGLSPEEFRVTPFVPAAGFCISPDCGAGVFWRVRDGHAIPLTREWGFDALLEDMATMMPGPRLIKWFKFILSAVRHVGLWFIPALWHWIGKGRPGRNELQLLSISTLMTPDKLDCQRFGRCTNGVLTASGAFCSPCYYYSLRFDSERKTRK